MLMFEKNLAIKLSLRSIPSYRLDVTIITDQKVVLVTNLLSLLDFA